MNARGGQVHGYHSGCGLGGCDWVLQRPLFRWALGFCLFEIAFYLSYRFGMSFSQECASPFWFPDSILLCALLLNRPGRWWIFIVAALPIRLFTGIANDAPYWFLLTTSAIDSAKGIGTAAALRCAIRNPLRLETIDEYMRFFLLAVVLIPAASAFGGAAARHALGYDYWRGWEEWFLGDALTHLVVTPAILYWLFGSPWTLLRASPPRRVEATFVAIGLVLTGYLAFTTRSGGIEFAEPRFYAPVPFLFWAAVRFGMLGASGAILLMASISVEAAIHGRGPFSGRSPADTALALQHFLLLRAAPLYLVAILIEQETRIKGSLKESEKRFYHMADTAPVLIWMAEPDKRCVFVNRGWLEFTGRPLEDELGNGWAERVHPEDRPGCIQVYEDSFDARVPFEMEYRLQRHDGEFRWMLARGVPRYASSGTFLGYIGSAIDITDRKRADDALQTQQAELAHMARVSTLGQLASSLAHEINQPLGAILRNAEAGELLLEQNPLDQMELRAILADIRRDDQRAGAVIDRMRALMKRQQLKLEWLSVKQMFDQVVLLARSEMQRRRMALRAELPPDLPLVQGDLVHLQQLLLNLFINGADAMSGLPFQQRQLVVSARCDENQMVEVAVVDAGHGIPTDRIGRIFEPFFTTKPDGLGIGLALAKSIIEAHGGRIWAENNPQNGATFRFTLRAGDSRRMAPAPGTELTVNPTLPSKPQIVS